MFLVVGSKDNCIMISPRQIINHTHIKEALSCVGEYQVQDGTSNCKVRTVHKKF